MIVSARAWVWISVAVSHWLLTTSLPVIASGYTAPLGQEMRRYRERQLFLEARDEARAGKLSKFRPILNQLGSYPLKAYLEFEALKARPYTRDSEVMNFVDNHPDLPVSNQLLSAFSQYRMDQRRPVSFLNFHKPGKGDQEMLCYRAAALWELRRLDEAIKSTELLWLQGQSQPKQCDKPFVEWRRQEGLTTDLAWQRWELAVLEGETRLARYLERYLNDEQRDQVKRLAALMKRPTQYSRYKVLDLNAKENEALVNRAIDQVAKKTPSKALALVAALDEGQNISRSRLLDFYQAAALRLVRSGEIDLDTIAIPAELKNDAHLLEADLLARISRDELAGIPKRIAKLPAASQLELRWQYWRARALERRQTIESSQAARGIFTALAEERDYYGHLAALWLKRPPSIADHSSLIPHENLLDLAASPAAQRMIELRALGEVTAARREWFMLIENFSDTELNIAAALASQWHWHDIAIATLAQSKAWNEVKIRFPMAYSELFADHALKHGVPMPLAMAVARRESGFWNEARSPVGAEGLMQLMPSTARLVAKDLNFPVSIAQSLNDPAVNIQLGTAYLGQMLQQFNDNRVLALAAYNAGPGRVKRWHQRKAPLDAWIESIPFKETRAYVKAGLLYAGIYRQLNGGIQPIVFPSEIMQFSDSDPLLEGLQPMVQPQSLAHVKPEK